jgi:hypothetical protein
MQRLVQEVDILKSQSTSYHETRASGNFLCQLYRQQMEGFFLLQDIMCATQGLIGKIPT